MPTAEFVSYLWSPSLPQEDLDEESVFGVGWNHDLLNVWVCRALIAAERNWESSRCDFLYSRICKKDYVVRFTAMWHHAEITGNMWGWVLSPDGHVSVLGLAWLGTALQWCLGDSWHGLVHQHLLVLHPLTCDTHKGHHTSLLRSKDVSYWPITLLSPKQSHVPVSPLNLSEKAWLFYWSSHLDAQRTLCMIYLL